MIETIGTNPSPLQEIFSKLLLFVSIITEWWVTSEPVPAVVGIAIIGSPFLSKVDGGL